MKRRDNGDEEYVDPADFDTLEEFLDECTAAGNDEDSCRMQWEESDGGNGDGRSLGKIVRKTHAGKLDGTEFILSDDSADRMGDIIEAAGWVLDDFKKNPIALFGHKADFPIGKWKNVKVKDNQLRGTLELAPAGASPRIDEIRALVDAGILKAVSVGFKPLDSMPLNPKDPWSGFRFSSKN